MNNACFEVGETIVIGRNFDYRSYFIVDQFSDDLFYGLEIDDEYNPTYRAIMFKTIRNKDGTIDVRITWSGKIGNEKNN